MRSSVQDFEAKVLASRRGELVHHPNVCSSISPLLGSFTFSKILQMEVFFRF